MLVMIFPYYEDVQFNVIFVIRGSVKFTEKSVTECLNGPLFGEISYVFESEIIVSVA